MLRGESGRRERMVLMVEPSKQAMDRVFSALRKPTRKLSDTTIISVPDSETLVKAIKSGAFGDSEVR